MKQIYFDYSAKYTENNYLAIDRRISSIFESCKNENKKMILNSLKNFLNAFNNFHFIVQDFELIHKA